MATPLQINGAIIQYAFINQINPVSRKYGFSALIPYSETCPQCQAIIAASQGEWAKVAAGSTNPQSLGYTILAPNDTKHIHESVIPMLDPTKYYLQVRAGQDGDAETLIPVYDSVPNLIPNGGIIGNGTIANIKVAAFGYATAGQKGVKYYAQWIQILNLVENLNAQSGPGAAEVTGGYVADATVLAAPVVQVPGAAVAPTANVMPQAGAVAPVATIPSAMPGVMPAAPVVAAPAVYAAPAVEAAPTQVYAAPAVEAAPVVYAAPTVEAAPVVTMPAAPVVTMPAAPAPQAAIAPVGVMPVAPIMPGVAQ